MLGLAESLKIPDRIFKYTQQNEPSTKENDQNMIQGLEKEIESLQKEIQTIKGNLMDNSLDLSALDPSETTLEEKRLQEIQILEEKIKKVEEPIQLKRENCSELEKYLGWLEDIEVMMETLQDNEKCCNCLEIQKNQTFYQMFLEIQDAFKDIGEDCTIWNEETTEERVKIEEKIIDQFFE